MAEAAAPRRIVEAPSFPAALEAIGDPTVDLALLDLRMPGAHGFSGLIALKAKAPAVPVIVVSGVQDQDVPARAAAYGASGFIAKTASPDRIITAIRDVLAGATPGLDGEAGAPDNDLARMIGALSPQQFRVMCLIADGLLNKQIAHELDLSLSTVKGHVTELLRKLGMTRRTQLIASLRTLSVGEETLSEHGASRQK